MSGLMDDDLLRRWPMLVTLPRVDWARAAAHLDAAAEARAAGLPCPWCPDPDARR